MCLRGHGRLCRGRCSVSAYLARLCSDPVRILGDVVGVWIRTPPGPRRPTRRRQSQPPGLRRLPSAPSMSFSGRFKKSLRLSHRHRPEAATWGQRRTDRCPAGPGIPPIGFNRPNPAIAATTRSQRTPRRSASHQPNSGSLRRWPRCSSPTTDANWHCLIESTRALRSRKVA